MKNYLLCFFVLFLTSNLDAQKNDILISVYDTISDECGYRNLRNEMIIPFGKYTACFSDTIDKYGIVLNAEGKFVAIDRNEKELYEVFPFDNGPDYEEDGLFRILQNDKIGYANAKTGQIVIKPQYQCAGPFENGKAKVTNKCTVEREDEHTVWLSESWFYVNKKGKKIKARKKEKK